MCECPRDQIKTGNIKISKIMFGTQKVSERKNMRENIFLIIFGLIIKNIK